MFVLLWYNFYLLFVFLIEFFFIVFRLWKLVYVYYVSMWFNVFILLNWFFISKNSGCRVLLCIVKFV